ncbi:helix-turn-helix domain-containing protein [Pseudoruegeria sp. SK021]|uniref:helix-turn-helix domain-containing protein n=1 Tax=Pseudoruegeria sp. SK021 TaxID=1933035 RepID=UPI000A25B568|nr:helix-turn-helix transcriptional regulator [Pseudoruegeria sp. SK021]OSP53538.1 hypothetical protein BV911_17460 [Pseudoruegeria sp. SK021]
MAGTVHTKAHREILSALVELRDKAGLSQAALAKLLHKPASFVGKYELGERRLDLVEIIVICGALKHDPVQFMRHAIEICERETG